jgi:Tn3 transposase DDE domain
MDTSGTGAIAPRGGRRNEGIVHTSNKVSAPVNDQAAGLGGKIVAGTPRDSLYVLDVLYDRDGGRRPEMIVTDTASYMDAAVTKLRGDGFEVREEDVARLSPSCGTTSTCWAATPSNCQSCPAGCGPCATRTPPRTSDRPWPPPTPSPRQCWSAVWSVRGRCTRSARRRAR